LQALIETSEAHDIWTLQAGIFPENTASMQLHLKHGFKLIGIHEKLGYMSFGPYKGKWRDVAFLERRSKVTGI
ncbi:MAG: N-acetyltransferase, partial [Candidatus Omnitrophica bacterium]|nr:N-acetyltransferase [Candidatus Omnitrophota bacterium]